MTRSHVLRSNVFRSHLLKYVLAILYTMAACVVVLAQNSQQAVPRLDLQKFSGNWFEIARTQNYWQRQCASDVTAKYVLEQSGKISIHNECRKANGAMTTSEGWVTAASAGPGNTVAGKMRAGFLWPFTFDYWVVALAPDYSWAVVAEPKRKNLWLIARAPALDSQTRERVNAAVAAAGFDPKTMQNTMQTPMQASRTH